MQSFFMFHNYHLRPIIFRIRTFDHSFYGILSWLWIFTPNVDWLSEINQFCKTKQTVFNGWWENVHTKLCELTSEKGQECCLRFGQHRRWTKGDDCNRIEEWWVWSQGQDRSFLWCYLPAWHFYPMERSKEKHTAHRPRRRHLKTPIWNCIFTDWIHLIGKDLCCATRLLCRCWIAKNEPCGWDSKKSANTGQLVPSVILNQMSS